MYYLVTVHKQKLAIRLHKSWSPLKKKKENGHWKKDSQEIPHSYINIIFSFKFLSLTKCFLKRTLEVYSKYDCTHPDSIKKASLLVEIFFISGRLIF